MQYILTENEFKNLVPKEELKKRDRVLAWCFEKLKPGYCTEMSDIYCHECIIGGLQNESLLEEFHDCNIVELLCKRNKYYPK